MLDLHSRPLIYKLVLLVLRDRRATCPFAAAAAASA